jgi:hypothetical protein
MPENIESILKNGFDAWKKNLNICIPFILNIIGIAILAVVTALVAIATIMGPLMPMSVEEVTPWLLLGQIRPMAGIIVLLFIVFIILAGLISAFFSAGAIGMAKKANKGKSATLSDMVEHGKKSFISVFFADIIVFLIALIGLIFVIPGLRYTPIDVLLADPLSDSLLAGCIFAFVLYTLIVSVVFVAVKYVIVIDNIGAIQGIKKGVGFFWDNKLSVLMLWIVMMAISIGLYIVSWAVEKIPYIMHVWPIIDPIIAIVIIAPLTIVWWARLYIDRTEKRVAKVEEQVA